MKAECDRCGDPIDQGELCDECLRWELEAHDEVWEHDMWLLREAELAD